MTTGGAQDLGRGVAQQSEEARSTATHEGATIALVTGAAHGIGLEVCRQLALRGCTVILTARQVEQAEQAAEQLATEGQTVTPRPLDVTDDASVHALADELAAVYGRLDTLINNAAMASDWSETASTTNLTKAHQMLEANLFGPWRVTQALLPLLRKSAHPRIVNVSSGAGSHGDPVFGLPTGHGATASYGVSKAALNALTTKFAAELEGTGILVNSVCPGLTATAPGMEAMGARPIPEGAASVLWAAQLADEGPSGGFFRDGEPLPW